MGCCLFGIALLVYFLLNLYGVLSPSSSFFTAVISKGNKEREVYLTFDDGPTENSAKILDWLKENRITAVFFLIGNQAKQQPLIVQRMIDEGHIVGAHTMTHRWDFPLRRPDNIATEIMKGVEVIPCTVEWFRPPFGVINPLVALGVKRTNLKIMTWSLRTFDGVTFDKYKIIQRLKKVKGKDIILFHDTNDDIISLLDRFNEIIDQKELTFGHPSSIGDSI
ncbi:polysaccharide deacetylase family protein [Persicobacter psychrovividus]|uniref:NodB homology domain-containing protein n=1 Tax=Persicobacter psychrovividus TaxID=387638 RepID=A0ABM7VM85_9BACT|nr:hypothetical protein PEPS_44100 [Persicobacter psychrovividus]